MEGGELDREDYVLAMEAASVFNALGFGREETSSVLSAVEDLTDIELKAWDDPDVKVAFGGDFVSFMESSTTNYDVSRFCKDAIFSRARHVAEFQEPDWFGLASRAIAHALETADDPEAMAKSLLAEALRDRDESRTRG